MSGEGVEEEDKFLEFIFRNSDNDILGASAARAGFSTIPEIYSS